MDAPKYCSANVLVLGQRLLFPLVPTNDEQQLLQDLRQGQEAALDQLFRQHYTYLCKAVYRVIPDGNTAEDIVQEVFADLWRKRERIDIQSSIRAYLRRATVNRSLNHIRDQKLMLSDESYLPHQLSSGQASAQQQLQAEELQVAIDRAIQQLPERCRLIFSLSRFEGMANKAIAKELDLSLKTVENQMTKALKMLKSALSHYLTILFAFISLIVN